MTRTTYLDETKNNSVAQIPANVQQRASEFEAAHGAEVLTVHHVHGDKWLFEYAINRGTKNHREYRAEVTA